MKSYREIFADVPLRIVTRQSKLAMAQTQIVASHLSDIAHDITGLSTSGDEVLDRPLVEIGGKGVFIKALELALIKGQADIAVHSFKDMETVLAQGTGLCCVLPRADRRDALVGAYRTVEALPQGAVVGTSSVRRAAILRNYRPDLEIKLLRGNVQRRLERLAAGDYDAIILAMAGLERLGLADQGHPLSEEVMMPAASQGVIAVQSATDDARRSAAIKDIFAALHCADTSDATTAERAMLAHLDGSCRTPIGAVADIIDGDRIQLSGMVLNTDGTQKYQASAIGKRTAPEALGIEVAEALLVQCGGRGFLA